MSLKLMLHATFMSLLGACAPGRGHTPVVQIDLELKPYVDRFVADAKAQGLPVQITDLIVKFGDLGTADEESSVVGLCAHEKGVTPVITINNNPNALNHWGLADDRFHEWVMYHELGHCVLQRVHNVNTWASPLDGVIPTSIMYIKPPNLTFYQDNRAHFISELFHP